ncbi:MAG: hypothetical protein ABGX22_17685 [Pirellulaceae bacterium]|nr:hypothetical protein [Planctomycetaceae bacterium]
MDNPYESAPARGKTEHESSLLAPAVCLLVLSVGFQGLLLVVLPGQVAMMREIDTSTPDGVGELAGSITAQLVWNSMTLAVILGSISMIRMKGYRSAVIAATCATVPVCSPCFVVGIPFGVWAMVLLRRPEVKSRFK